MPAASTAASAKPKKKIAKLPAAPVRKSPAVKKPAKKVEAAAVAKAEPKKAKTAAANEKSEKPAAEHKEKQRKPKLVRDSFTMPENEYAALGDVKKACLKAGLAVKKSELLRVGVSLVRQLDVEKLKEIVAGLPVLKAGRPKKNK